MYFTVVYLFVTVTRYIPAFKGSILIPTPPCLGGDSIINELERLKESVGLDLNLCGLHDLWTLSWASLFGPIFLSYKMRENHGRDQ